MVCVSSRGRNQTNDFHPWIDQNNQISMEQPVQAVYRHIAHNATMLLLPNPITCVHSCLLQKTLSSPKHATAGITQPDGGWEMRLFLSPSVRNIENPLILSGVFAAVFQLHGFRQGCSIILIFLSSASVFHCFSTLFFPMTHNKNGDAKIISAEYGELLPGA